MTDYFWLWVAYAFIVVGLTIIGKAIAGWFTQVPVEENEEKSTHKVEIVRVESMEKHSGADTLSIIHIFDGYQCIVRTEDWKIGDLAAYLPPDSLVDTTREEFSFLGEHTTHESACLEGKFVKDSFTGENVYWVGGCTCIAPVHHKAQPRIKAKKLRGEWSQGLLIKAPAGSKVGDNVTAQLGVSHYEPEVKWNSTNYFKGDKPPVSFSPQRGVHPVYDVDSLRRYGKYFQEGEPVWITEKLHGTNARYTFEDGVMWVGSHKMWRPEPEDRAKDLYWSMLVKYPQIEEFCRKNASSTLYGEIYGGGVQKGFDYGKKEPDFAAFDLMDSTGKFLDAPAFFSTLKNTGIRMVPNISMDFPFVLEVVLDLAERKSLLKLSQIAEGIVIKPRQERFVRGLGRLNLKVVSNQYLEKSE